jgi:hypothetical protein
VLLGGFGLVLGVRAGEEKVALKDVPKAVLDTFKARFPHAEIKQVEKETDADNEVVYEFGITADGKNIDVSVEADGELASIETEIAVKDIPAPVKKALDAKYPGAPIKKAEAVSEFDDGKEEKTIEVILTAKGKDLEVVLTPDGKIVKEEEAED